MRNRDFLMRPFRYKDSQKPIGGWFACEYKHGIQCFWDGGVSRGQLLRDIPWAHLPAPSSDTTLSTGLWSQSLKPLPATNSWLNQLPAVFLEGVIYQEAGEKYFGATDSPSPDILFRDGVLTLNSSARVKFNKKRNMDWLASRRQEVIPHLETLPPDTHFDLVMEFLSIKLKTHGTPCHLMRHKKLSNTNALAELEQELKMYNNGVTIRDPASTWSPGINHSYLLVL